tara:strand:+ start:4475 stop:4636 length:162 start_codon:yes stop_codon:yes gene_type:complete
MPRFSGDFGIFIFSDLGNLPVKGTFAKSKTELTFVLEQTLHFEIFLKYILFFI